MATLSLTANAHPLRLALRADGLACAGAGLVLLLGAPVLPELLGLPLALVLSAGAFLVPFAVVLWLLAARPAPGSRETVPVVALNALWVVGSVAVVLVAAPTAFGVAFVLAQALAVAGITVVEELALRTVARETA
ncbi:hypothetical protein AB0I72_15480 [Nocardiopsis sp. NPDC049922]|uniref:hypothetical protein n=1 Tax=Nocardiopsis sp. NPDC049922 TaxID=3155157 RepID=UPI0033CD2629